MSSILKVDQLKDSGGNAIITSDGSGNITTGKGMGKVLQVVQGSNDATVSTTSTSFVDITSVTASITPISSSNKIMVIYWMFLKISPRGGVRKGPPGARPTPGSQ